MKVRIHLKDRWDVWFVAVVIFARIFLNLEMRPLSLAFAAAYVLFLYMLFAGVRYFGTSFVLFLVVDSALATYFATVHDNFDWIFFGTVLVNLTAIGLLVQNLHGKMKK